MDSVSTAHIPRPSDPKKATIRLVKDCAFSAPKPGLRLKKLSAVKSKA
jgi:hypothetical protein